MAVMASIFDDILPSAKDCPKNIAQAAAEKPAATQRARYHEEPEKHELLERFWRPSEVDDEKRLKGAAAIIDRTVANGQTKTQVLHFPTGLCTDLGHAI
ncbi:MAG: hypothetical protein HC900_06005 [Methylacidiphilales bacterium]|nr:hypothetical protein [Candidatus Methylacidiphilales bacterium]